MTEKQVKAACGNCGREYDFPKDISEINCACGAKVFRPKEEDSVPPAKEEKTLAPPKERATSKKEVESKLKELDKPPENPEPTADELRKEAEEKRRKEEEGSKEEPAKEEKTLLQKLIAIPGIAEKAAEEICEEYKTIETIKEAINNKTFSVGGVGFLKKQVILKLLK